MTAGERSDDAATLRAISGVRKEGRGEDMG